MLNHHILLFVLIFVCWPRGEEYDATKEIRHIKVSGMRQCSAQWTNLYTLQTICVIGSSVWFIFMYSFIFLFLCICLQSHHKYLYEICVWCRLTLIFILQTIFWFWQYCIDYWSFVNKKGRCWETQVLVRSLKLSNIEPY